MSVQEKTPGAMKNSSVPNLTSSSHWLVLFYKEVFINNSINKNVTWESM